MQNRLIDISQLKHMIEAGEGSQGIDPADVTNMLESVLLASSTNSDEDDSEQINVICRKMLKMLWHDVYSD